MSSFTRYLHPIWPAKARQSYLSCNKPTPGTRYLPCPHVSGLQISPRNLGHECRGKLRIRSSAQFSTSGRTVGRAWCSRIRGVYAAGGYDHQSTTNFLVKIPGVLGKTSGWRYPIWCFLCSGCLVQQKASDFLHFVFLVGDMSNEHFNSKNGAGTVLLGVRAFWVNVQLVNQRFWRKRWCVFFPKIFPTKMGEKSSNRTALDRSRWSILIQGGYYQFPFHWGGCSDESICLWCPTPMDTDRSVPWFWNVSAWRRGHLGISSSSLCLVFGIPGKRTIFTRSSWIMGLLN